MYNRGCVAISPLIGDRNRLFDRTTISMDQLCDGILGGKSVSQRQGRVRGLVKAARGAPAEEGGYTEQFLRSASHSGADCGAPEGNAAGRQRPEAFRHCSAVLRPGIVLISQCKRGFAQPRCEPRLLGFLRVAATELGSAADAKQAAHLGLLPHSDAECMASGEVYPSAGCTAERDFDGRIPFVHDVRVESNLFSSGVAHEHGSADLAKRLEEPTVMHGKYFAYFGLSRRGRSIVPNGPAVSDQTSRVDKFGAAMWPFGNSGNG